MALRIFASLAAVAVCGFASAAFAQSDQRNENGIGPDPDRDGNPATRTLALASIGAEDARLDPRFRVISFEPPPGRHGDKIANQYAERFGAHFSKGLNRQICEEGQRYFRYDTFCSYIAPPSGAYAAHYRTDRRDPLVVTFDKPVCAAALSIRRQASASARPNTPPMDSSLHARRAVHRLVGGPVDATAASLAEAGPNATGENVATSRRSPGRR